MTPLISARRTAEDFARVVDGSHEGPADRYGDLTATVALLRSQKVPAARAEFVDDLRAQLMAAADTLLLPAEEARPTELAPVVTLRHSRRQRRVATLAAAFVIVGGSAGVAAAAENALPGDPLYPIKRGIESAQVSLNTSDSARGRDLIGQAGTRLDEIDALVSDGDAAQVASTLDSYSSTVADGADLLFVAYQRDPQTADLAALRETLLAQHDRLSRLSEQAPPTTQGDFDAASALITDLDQQARVLCGNCGPAGGVAFGDLSSAPALQGLLAGPAARAEAQQQASLAKALAEKAGQIASTTPKATDPSGTGTDATTQEKPGTILPGTSTSTAPSTTLKGTVTTVTDGVGTVVDQVGSTTGLTPLTDTVDTTVDSLTNLLLGQ